MVRNQAQVWRNYARNNNTYVDRGGEELARNGDWVMAHRYGYEMVKLQEFAAKYGLTQEEANELQYDCKYYEPLNWRDNASRIFDAPRNVNLYEEDGHAPSVARKALLRQQLSGEKPTAKLTPEQEQEANFYANTELAIRPLVQNQEDAKDSTPGNGATARESLSKDQQEVIEGYDGDR